MRLDKFLSDMKCATRSQLKKDIRAGLVTVNGEIVRQSDYTVDEKQDKICYKGNAYEYEKFVYYMLNKPAGVVSATEDKREKTVVDLLKDIGRNDLFPMGRLDKDTEGLLIMTNDGVLAHELLSPTKHVEKVYECTLAVPFDGIQKEALEKGVDIGEKKLTMPAKVVILEEKKIALTIMEGKFHQVKRMLQAVGNEVIYLKRVCMGGLALDESLQPGQYRKLTSKEVMLLQEKQ
ncbi:MAG: rRNA pseudouridine synthase [Lachnospiraceae bacterium]|nr:rRNA pseudouridine synthase [Lachnospiraceae bacterium]